MRVFDAFALGRAFVLNRDHVACGFSDRGQFDLSWFCVRTQTIEAGIVENDTPFASQVNFGIAKGGCITVFIAIDAKQVLS